MDKLQSLPDACFPNLGIVFQELDRVAFSIFGFDIYWYGLFICTGVVLGFCMLMYNVRAEKENPDPYIDFVFYGLISGITGARAYYLIFNDKSLINFFAFRDGGLAIYGGVIAAVIAVVVYTRIKKLPLFRFTDIYAAPLLVGQIVGRMGNFVNREAFGRATTGLFSLMYKADEVPHLTVNADTALYRGISEYPLTIISGTAYISVHPTFLYEMMCNILIVIIMVLYRRHKKFDGEISCMYFLFYGIGRFFIESIRTDQLMIGNIPVSMIVSAVVAASALCALIVCRRRCKTVTKS
ncbi:MAG: prolipoprotein diacylglyceryl transferase [Firmicutes bacterium]|nr:prolipoprotein diacylglyceryl transferase [Bacillota bacterium]